VARVEEKIGRGLRKKDQLFVDEYLLCFNATEAYMKIHPKSKRESAWVSASRLLSSDKVTREIQSRLKGVHMSANEALSLLADMARGDVAKLMDVGSMGFNLDMAKAKEAGLTKLIKKVKQKTTIYQAKKESEEGREVTELEIELYDAQAAIDKVLKVHGKYVDRVDLTSGGEVILRVVYTDKKPPNKEAE